MSKNPHHIDKGHPVRMLLHVAVTDELTTGAMREHLDRWDEHLPEGHNLSRFRGALSQAAAEVHTAARTGDKARARRMADDYAAQIAGRMSDQERAVAGDPDPEPLADISARMFGS